MKLSPHQEPVQVREVHHYHAGPHAGTAVLLELLPGLFAQTFGIGNIYAGQVWPGIFMMLGYWALSVVNFLLCFLLIGFVTWPLTWIAFMVFCPMAANDAAREQAWRGDRDFFPRD